MLMCGPLAFAEDQQLYKVEGHADHQVSSSGLELQWQNLTHCEGGVIEIIFMIWNWIVQGH